jgi:hypothetical protein
MNTNRHEWKSDRRIGRRWPPKIAVFVRPQQDGAENQKIFSG